MGKKSKAKARSGKTGRLASSASAAAEPGAVVPATGNDGGKKNARVRCFECCATVKISEGKGHQCVGCWEIYCWRCEAKYFAECPNGDQCVRPIRRCYYCTGSTTMVKAMKEMGIVKGVPDLGQAEEQFQIHFNAEDEFEKILSTSDKYTRDAIGMRLCGNAVDGICCANECARCTEDSAVHTLLRCKRCRKTRCRRCSHDHFEGVIEALQEFERNVSVSVSAEKLAEIYGVSPSAFAVCGECCSQVCFECASNRELLDMAFSDIDATHQGRKRSKEGAMKCDDCYYAKKPCTNPSCPNPVGVPTKRCGGCHISRYCSKQCQAAAYPEHKAKCERMQKKLESKADGNMSK